MVVDSAVFFLTACLHCYWSSHLALIFPYLRVFVPRVKRMVKPAKFAPSRTQTGRNRGEKRRLLRDVAKEKKREARACSNTPCKGRILRMKKGSEMRDSTFVGVEGVMRDGAAGAGAVAEGQPHSFTRLVSRCLSWPSKQRAVATPVTIAHTRHIDSPIACGRKIPHDPSKLSRPELALSQAKSRGPSLFLHAHVQYLLPWTVKKSALFWNLVGIWNDLSAWAVVGIISFGWQNSTASGAHGQKRRHVKEDVKDPGRKKSRGCHHNTSHPNDDGDDNGDEKRPKGPGKGHYESPEEPFFWLCPFFILDPVRHWRCNGKYMMKRYSDVKLHMLRRHAFKGVHYCRDCGQEWTTRSAWATHCQEDCTANPLPDVDNLDPVEAGDFESKDFKNEPNGDEDKYNWMWSTCFSGWDLLGSPHAQNTINVPLVVLRRNGVSALQAYLDSLPASQTPDARRLIDEYERATTEAAPRYRRRPPMRNNGPAPNGPPPNGPPPPDDPPSPNGPPPPPNGPPPPPTAPSLPPPPPAPTAGAPQNPDPSRTPRPDTSSNRSRPMPSTQNPQFPADAVAGSGQRRIPDIVGASPFPPVSMPMVPPDVRNAPPLFVPNSAAPEQLHHQSAQPSQEPAPSAQPGNAFYDPTLTSPADPDELFPWRNPISLQDFGPLEDYPSFDDLLGSDDWMFNAMGSPSDLLAGESVATTAAGALLADGADGVSGSASNGGVGGEFPSSTPDDSDAGRGEQRASR